MFTVCARLIIRAGVCVGGVRADYSRKYTTVDEPTDRIRSLSPEQPEAASVDALGGHRRGGLHVAPAHVQPLCTGARAGQATHTICLGVELPSCRMFTHLPTQPLNLFRACALQQSISLPPRLPLSRSRPSLSNAHPLDRRRWWRARPPPPLAHCAFHALCVC